MAVHDTMMNPSIEELLSRVDSKFSLVTLAARRARQINSYFNHLGDSLGSVVPPQVTSVARKPLSIGFEEIAADKIAFVRIEPDVDFDEADVEIGVEISDGTDEVDEVAEATVGERLEVVADAREEPAGE